MVDMILNEHYAKVQDIHFGTNRRRFFTYIHTSYITFISGAKPIAENRHDMKRTKIKHTTHTHKPIDRKKLR